LISALLCIPLYIFYGPWSLLFLAGGVLIDIDHYIFYVVKKKDFSIKRMYDYCIDSTYNHIFCIFHNIEFVTLLLIISVIIPLFSMLTAGVIIHLIIDLISVYYKGRLRKEIRAFSLIARTIK